MPFKKMDVKNEIKKRIESDSEFKEAYTKVEREYDLIKSIVRLRKEMNITQKDISEKTGLTQQMVSRIEKYNNSPRLNNFIEYINAIGLDIDLKEKQKV
jgi:DNA-binding XRE family transcriptional regulator